MVVHHLADDSEGSSSGSDESSASDEFCAKESATSTERRASVKRRSAASSSTARLPGPGLRCSATVSLVFLLGNFFSLVRLFLLSGEASFCLVTVVFLSVRPVFPV